MSGFRAVCNPWEPEGPEADVTIQLREPYSRRPVRFIELLVLPGWRLKVYGIAYGSEFPRPELVHVGRIAAGEHLVGARSRHTDYGVGFLGIHQGRGENQVFLDRWVNENELLHDIWVSPVDRPTELRRPAPDHNSVCVWDLAVQCFEREAWLANVLNNPRGGPDIEAYLAARLNADV